MVPSLGLVVRCIGVMCDGVMKVIDAADDSGRNRVVERDGSENGHDDDFSSRRRRRGRSRCEMYIRHVLLRTTYCCYTDTYLNTNEYCIILVLVLLVLVLLW